MPFKLLPVVMVTCGADVKPRPHSALLKPAARAAWTKVIPAELFGQFFASMHDAETHA
jgi:hypothetical protein